MNKEKLTDLIRLSWWGTGTVVADRDIYEEMKQQTIAVLPADCLSSLGLSHELLHEWKKHILEQLVLYDHYLHEQTNLPISVPYVVLKGTAAAQYYPHPEYRMMGDIDIMTRREDFNIAYQQLLDHGFHAEKVLNREASLVRGWVAVELHQRFASLNDPDQAKYFDDLIIDNITPSHTLPDPINGLVILEHISKHMESGLGLRQIIDWMMFVDKCLPDEKWPEFCQMAAKINIDKLAIVTTKMCEKYLGLPHREWCADADTDLCDQLMEYILSCGNFGNKMTSDAAISENAFAFASTPKMAFKLLQMQGLTNWKAAKEHKILKPFAWIYQAFRYASRGLKRKGAVSKIKAEYSAAMKRNAMLNSLCVTRQEKGMAILKDGKYVKE